MLEMRLRNARTQVMPAKGRPDMNTELMKAILAAVRSEELSAVEYRASTKHLIEQLPDYDAKEVGGMTEILVLRERCLKGRDYPPRKGSPSSSTSKLVEVGLFDAL